MYLSINNSLTQAGFKLTDTQLVIARDGQGFRFKCRDWSIDTNTSISLVKRSRKSRPSLPIAADLSSSTHMSLLDTPTVRVGDATPISRVTISSEVSLPLYYITSSFQDYSGFLISFFILILNTITLYCCCY